MEAHRVTVPVDSGLAGVFATLKRVLAEYAKHLSVKTDTPVEYTLVTKSASPFTQHKGQPMYFGRCVWARRM